MPGASKKRGKLDRQGPRGPGQGPAPATAAAVPTPEAAPQPEDPVAYDGPGDNRGGPSSSRPQGSRGGRPPTGAPSHAGPSTSQQAPSDSPAPESSRPKVDPAKEQSMILNKNVDFAGNAYNLISQVSSRLDRNLYSRT